MKNHDSYLSGRISGDKNYFANFAKWEKFVKENYYIFDLFTPTMTKLDHGEKTEKEIWQMYLEFDIPIVCQCQFIFMLPWWWLSKGARLEWFIAKNLGKRIIYLKNRMLTK